MSPRGPNETHGRPADEDSDSRWARERAFDPSIVDAVCDTLAAAASIRMAMVSDSRDAASFRDQLEHWRAQAESAGGGAIPFRAACEVWRLTERGDVILNAWTSADRLRQRVGEATRRLGVYVAVVWIVGLSLWWWHTQSTSVAVNQFVREMTLPPKHSTTGSLSSVFAAASFWFVLSALAIFILSAAFILRYGWNRVAMWFCGPFVRPSFQQMTVTTTSDRLVAMGLPPFKATKLASALVQGGEGFESTPLESTPSEAADRDSSEGGWIDIHASDVAIIAEDRLRWTLAMSLVVGLIIFSAPIVIGFAAAVFLPLYEMYGLLTVQG